MTIDSNRPLCSCGRPVQWGKKSWRKTCSRCQKQKAADNKGMTLAEYENYTHPTRKHKKKFCENVDGHLGYVCTARPEDLVVDGVSLLTIDHADGNPSNNEISNLRTYCMNCHTYKSRKNKDHLSPGRKTLNVRKH